MILPWNRREIYCGFSLKEFNKVLDVLAAKGIKYIYRTPQSGTIVVNRLYYVYVHKSDKELAQFLVSKSRN